MLKAYKYRLYPSDVQQRQMDNHFGCNRLIWNLALEAKKRAWESCKINLSRSDLQKQLVELKHEYQWLYDVNSQALQCVLLNLDNAFKAFFKGAGYPKFKKKSGHQSFRCPQRASINGKYLVLPNIKKVRVEGLVTFEGKIKTVTITKTRSGKYFASILVDNAKEFPQKAQINPATTIGIDIGIKSFVVTSDGKSFDPNRYLKSNLNIACWMVQTDQ